MYKETIKNLSLNKEMYQLTMQILRFDKYFIYYTREKHN